MHPKGTIKCCFASLSISRSGSACASAPHTLSQWLAEYRELTTYARLRPALLPQFRPHHLIRSTRLHHQQVYHYRINQGKHASLLSNPEHQTCRPLETYLTEMATSCPHPLFQEEHRASASA